MRTVFLLLFCFVISNTKAGNNPNLFRASNERSDTIDIIHTTISLDLSASASTQQIVSCCKAKFVSLMNNVNQINFDLLKLPVDSVVDSNNQNLLFDYSDSLLLKVFLSTTLNSGDTSIVSIYYHGHPTLDVTAGGFYIQPPYFLTLVFRMIWFRTLSGEVGFLVSIILLKDHLTNFLLSHLQV